MASGLFGTSTPEARLQQTRIQPAGVATTAPLRPQQVQTGSNLSALAGALGGLNSALETYANVKKKVGEDPNSLATKEWEAKRQQMTLDELLNDPDRDTNIRVRQDIYNGLLGERMNADWRVLWQERQAEGFGPEDDIGAIYNEMRAEFAQRTESEIARGAFFKLSNNHFSQTVETATQERLDYAKQQVNTTIVDSWHLKIGDMITAGEADPAKIAEEVFTASKDNEKFFNLSGKEQDETIFALASRAAMEGNPEIAKALLFTKRNGIALGEVPAYAAKAHNLLETANKKLEESDNKGSFETRLAVNRGVAAGNFTAEDAEALPNTLYSPAQKAALVAQADAVRQRIAAKTATDEDKRNVRIYAEREKNNHTAGAVQLMGELGGVFKIKDQEVPSPSGTGTTTYSREAQIDDAKAYMENQWAAQEAELAESLGDPQKARQSMDDVRLAWYAGNGLVNQRWKGQINALPLMANPETFANNPAAAEKFVETAESYRRIKNQNPAYAETLLDPKSREFLDLYEVAVDAHQLPGKDALAYASGWANRPEAEKVRYRIKPADADKIVKDVLYKIGADSYEGMSFGIINQKVQTWASQGLDADQIRENTQRWATSSTVLVNGVVMASERPLPGDFVNLADRFLSREYARVKDAYALDDPKDLFLQPVSGETKWQVWSKSLGAPIGNTYLDPDGLNTERGLIEEEREKNIREKAQAKAEKDKESYEFWRKSVEAREPEIRTFVQQERERIRQLRLPQKSWLNGYNPPNNRAADEAEESLRDYLQGLQLEHLFDE